MKLSTFQRIVLVLGIAFLGLSFLPHVLSNFAVPDKVFMYLMLLEISAFIVACTAIGCFLFYTVLPDPDFKLTCKKWFTVTSLLFALSMAIPFCSASICGSFPFASFVAPFDAVQWRNSASSAHLPGNISIRQQMVGNAVRKYVLNHTKGEIVAVLGPSEV